MKFSLPSLGTILSYGTGLATLIVAAESKVSELPFHLPPVVLTGLAAAGMAARLYLHCRPSLKDTLQPTPDLIVEDTGPALGKASGAAGAAAGKGPFGGGK